MKPGDILKSAVIAGKMPNGDYILKGKIGKNRYIAGKFAPPEPLETGKQVNNLICMRNSIFGLKGYCEEDLIKHFFAFKGKVVSNNQATKTWRKRWRQISDGRANATVSRQAANEISISPPNRHREWRFAESENWIMPFQGIKSSLLPEAYELFCPTPQNRTDFLSHVLPANYCNNGISPSLPRSLKGSFKAKGKEKEQEVILKLYPPLIFPKWHFGIWKHVLSRTKNGNRNEKYIWGKLPGFDTCSHVHEDTFSKCRENEEGSCCEINCTGEEFQKVHGEIGELCNRYLEKAIYFLCVKDPHGSDNVTFFSSSSTIKVWWRWSPTSKLGTKGEIKGFTEILIGRLGPQIECKKLGGWYPKLVFRGWCYNWNDQERNPVWYLNLVTCYLQQKRSPIVKEPKNGIWKHGYLRIEGNE